MAWQYLTAQVDSLDSAELNFYGRDGWELVGFVPNLNNQGYTESFTCIFKRPVEER